MAIPYYSISYADGTLAVADLPATVESVSQNAMLNMPEIATSDQGASNPPAPADQASGVKQPSAPAPNLPKGAAPGTITPASAKPLTLMNGLLEVDPALARNLAINDTGKANP